MTENPEITIYKVWKHANGRVFLSTARAHLTKKQIRILHADHPQAWHFCTRLSLQEAHRTSDEAIEAWKHECKIEIETRQILLTAAENLSKVEIEDETALHLSILRGKPSAGTQTDPEKDTP